MSGLHMDIINLERKVRELGKENEQLKERNPCPCLHTTPCHKDCTCVNGDMSRGCLRCCTYGSPEQQKAAAERLVSLAVKAAAFDWLAGRVPLINDAAGKLRWVGDGGLLAAVQQARQEQR